jgi:hypothetical protein
LPKSHFSIEGAMIGIRLRSLSSMAERLMGESAPLISERLPGRRTAGGSGTLNPNRAPQSIPKRNSEIELSHSDSLMLESAPSGRDKSASTIVSLV